MALNASVVALRGTVLVLDEAGTPRMLAVGDQLRPGDTVRPAAGAEVELLLDDGRRITLGADQVLELGPDILLPAEPTAAGAVQTVIEALERGDNLDDIEAAAAGLGGGGGGDGSSFVRLLRIAEGVTPLQYDYQLGEPGEIQDIELGAIPEAEPELPLLRLDADREVEEGGPGIRYRAVLDRPASSDMTVTLSNGAVINIPAGADSGTVLVPVQGDDPYVDPETLSARIDAVQGGGFDSVLVADEDATTQVIDTLNPTLVTLTAGDVDEDQAGVTFTATLSHPGQTDVTVVTSLGNILIPAGETSGTLFVSTADPDVYLDPGRIAASVNGLVGGNFELVDFSAASAEAAINDTVDTTTVGVSAGDVDENAAGVIFTVTLSQPGQTDVKVVTNLGEVLIPAGQTSGTLFVNTADPDVYRDPDSLSISVNGLVGGNFERVDYSAAQATAQIADTIDQTAVSLGVGDVDENATGVTFTATLSHPGQTDVTVVTSLGDILIPAGQTSGTLFVATADPDVYLDPGSITARVTGLVGGNFEAVDFEGVAASARIFDTLDRTTVSLTAGNVDEDQAGVTFTATLSHPGQTDVTVVTDLGNILIPAGETTGTLLVNTANPDVYIDPGVITASVTGILGGNFEAVAYEGVSATAQIADTLDTSYLRLGDVTAFEGGTATLTASVTASVTGTDLLVTLSNGATITIPVGQSSGVSTPFVVANAEDPYLDQGAYQVGVLSASGGNYESLATSVSATVTVLDTIDPTAITLGDATAYEGGYATVSAAVAAPVTGSDLHLTLSNGATITIPVGQSNGISTPFAVANAEDPYTDASAYEVGIQSVSGGNYEALVLSDTASIGVADTRDLTGVSLSATPDFTEDGVTLTYQVELGAPVRAGDAPVVVSFKDLAGQAQTITIASGSVGTVQALIPESVYEDVYAENPQSLAAATDVAVSGGSFEALGEPQVGSVQLVDTVDRTTFALAGPDSVPEGQAFITYTVSGPASTPVQGSPLVFQLSNGYQVSIPVGASSGSVDVPLPEGSLSLDPVTITGSSGGNYETVAFQGEVITDIDSQPSDATGTMALAEAGKPSGSVLLTFDTGADAMDPALYAFVSPSVATPEVTGLNGVDGGALQWALINPDTLQAQTSQGTLVLTLSGASASGVYVIATLDGNLLHEQDLVTVDRVRVDAYDTDGDKASATVRLTISDSQPTALFTSTVGAAGGEGIYTGLWSATQGVDDTVPMVADVTLDGATVDGQPAVAVFDSYDAQTGRGSGTLTSGALTIGFDFELKPDGSYVVDLGAASKEVSVVADEFSGSTDPSGPTDVYTISYLDEETGETATASVTSLARLVPTPPPLSLPAFGSGGSVVQQSLTPIGTAVNVSGDGIGFQNNLLSSYPEGGKHDSDESEVLIYNPEGEASSVVVQITGSGANAFGGSQADLLYLTLVGESGQQQTLMLDSLRGIYLVDGDALLPYSGESQWNANRTQFTALVPDGWDHIAELRVLPGLHISDAGDVSGSVVKLAFGFTTSTMVQVDVPVQLDFTATVIDADGDPASSAFSLLTYTETAAVGTPGPDVIEGTPGADSYAGLAGDDWLMASAGSDLIAGGEGLDTVDYSRSAESVAIDLAGGIATASLSGQVDTLVDVENVVGSGLGDSIRGDSGANVLEGGPGDDQIIGGGGLDTAAYDSAEAGVVASLADQGDLTPDVSGGAGSDTLSDISNLRGSDFSDILRGDNDANELFGGGGDDSLYGGGGADTLYGGEGDDLIAGGPGDDLLSGGPGSDTFDYEADDSGADWISDFTLAHVDDGGDSIDLDGLIDAPGNTADFLSDFVSFAADAEGHAVIQIDANGDGVPDDQQSITLRNVSLSELQAYAGSDSDVEIIRKLLENGNLKKNP